MIDKERIDREIALVSKTYLHMTDEDRKAYNRAAEALKTLDSHGGIDEITFERLHSFCPLTPITDDDFFHVINEAGETVDAPEVDPYDPHRHGLPEGIKSRRQCPRSPRVVRIEYTDGNVKYIDILRTHCVDIETHMPTALSCVEDTINELFPIKMPYMPFAGHSTPAEFICYVRRFTTSAYSRCDTVGFLYVILSDGTRFDINRYWTIDNGTWKEITVEDYLKLLDNRIDKIPGKVAASLLNAWTYINQNKSVYIDDTDCRTNWLNEVLGPTRYNQIVKDLTRECDVFEDRTALFTPSVMKALCTDTLMTTAVLTLNPLLKDIHIFMTDLERQYTEYCREKNKNIPSDNAKSADNQVNPNQNYIIR